jgi:predicted Zn-dependent protease
MVDLKKILSLSPVTDTELTYSREDIYYTRYSNSSISENIKKSGGNLKIRLIENGRTGVFTTNRLDDEGIKDAYKKALKLMRKDKSILNLLSVEQKYKSSSKYDEKTASFSPLEKAKILKEIFGKDSNAVISGLFTNGSEYIAIANSKGIFAEHKSSFASVSFTVKIDGGTSSWEKESFCVDELNAVCVYEEAKKYALLNKSPKDIDAGGFDVVLTPLAFKEIIEMLLYYGLNTLPYVEKRSPFNGKMGKRVASELFSLKDDAFEENAGGLPFDFEGHAKKSVSIIKNGILKGFVQDRKTAKKMKTKSSGHSLGEPDTSGPFALNPVIKGSDKTGDDLIKGLKKGLYIRKLHYSNLLNEKELLITGMTRDGVYYVENGQISHPVNNLRFGDTIFNILKNIEELGEEEVTSFGLGFGKLPWVRIKDFKFTSKTGF